MRLPLSCSSILFWGLLLACGCDALSAPRRTPPKAAQPVAESPASQAPARPGAASAPAAGESVAPPTSRLVDGADQSVPRSAVVAAPLEDSPSRTSPDTSAPRPTADEAIPVRLSAGVALPQSLPTGTSMGFSVDYEFETGGPQPSYRYLWIIRASGADQPWESPVQLESQGTLQTFVLPWRPEQGPFHAELVEVRPDGSRRPLSSPVLLKAADR